MPRPTLRVLLHLALLIALPLAAVPAASQSTAGPLVTPVALSSPDNGRALAAVNAPLGYLDGDVDLVVDADEPAYLDLDASGTVTVGDLRLAPFGTVPAGTEVAVADGDASRRLERASGWFGQSGTSWYADLDGTRTVTEADVRIDTAPQRVAAGSPERGQALSFPTTALLAGSVAIDDADRDGRHDRGEAAFLDLDTSARSGPPVAGAGDLRFTPSAVAAGEPVSRAEFEDALRQLGVEAEPGGGFTGAASGDAGEGGIRGLDIVLLVLAAANLAGLVVVLRSSRGPPRNPFK